MNFQTTDETNWCGSFDATRVGWPPSGYSYREITVAPEEIPPEGYGLQGPYRSELGRIYYDKETGLFSLFANGSGERCYLHEGSVTFAINNALMVRGGILHIAMSPP